MSKVEENKAIMRRMIEEIWNKGNMMVAQELFHEDHYSPSAPDLPKGPESVIMLATMFRSAMPDYHMTIDLLVADETKVVGRFTQSGTHIGAPLMEMQPSGRHAEWTEIGVLEIENGKIMRSWYEVDMLSMIQQLNPQNGQLSHLPQQRGERRLLTHMRWSNLPFHHRGEKVKSTFFSRLS